MTNLQAAEAPSSYGSKEEFRHMNIKLNRVERKQKVMHRDLHTSTEKMAKLMTSGIKLIYTKLETNINRVLKHINPDKGKAKDSFVPDLLSIKTTNVKTNHENVIYQTNDILWIPSQTAFGCSTAENGKVTMQRVHIISKNSKNSPQYNFSYKPYPDDIGTWTKLHKDRFSPS